MAHDARRERGILLAGVLWYSALLIATAGVAVAAKSPLWAALVGLFVAFAVRNGQLLYALGAKRRGREHTLVARVVRSNRPLVWVLHFAALGLCAGVVLAYPEGRRYEASYLKDDHERALRELASASGDRERFYELGRAAKTSVFFGPPEDARRYAEELLDLALRVGRNWNYGNAVHDGHVVLGLLALREGRVEDAKTELLLAGRTPGSPQLDTFGPNMSLARDLLRRGEGATVLEYFGLCRWFWKLDHGALDRWEEDVRQGREPDFGANLVF